MNLIWTSEGVAAALTVTVVHAVVLASRDALHGRRMPRGFRAHARAAFARRRGLARPDRLLMAIDLRFQLGVGILHAILDALVGTGFVELDSRQRISHEVATDHGDERRDHREKQSSANPSFVPSKMHLRPPKETRWGWSSIDPIDC